MSVFLDKFFNRIVFDFEEKHLNGIRISNIRISQTFNLAFNFTLEMNVKKTVISGDELYLDIYMEIYKLKLHKLIFLEPFFSYINNYNILVEMKKSRKSSGENLCSSKEHHRFRITSIAYKCTHLYQLRVQ